MMQEPKLASLKTPTLTKTATNQFEMATKAKKAESFAKAQVYRIQRHNYILVSRVVLGLIHRTQEQCPSFIKPPDGFDSVMAGPFTKSQLGHLGLGFDFQLHNEHIVYDDSACYPEFVLVMP